MEEQKVNNKLGIYAYRSYASENEAIRSRYEESWVSPFQSVLAAPRSRPHQDSQKNLWDIGYNRIFGRQCAEVGHIKKGQSQEVTAISNGNRNLNLSVLNDPISLLVTFVAPVHTIHSMVDSLCDFFVTEIKYFPIAAQVRYRFFVKGNNAISIVRDSGYEK